MNHEYCYILQEREFIKSNEDIYKIGRTTSLNRFNSYPKGSKIICLRCVNDFNKTERQLKKKKFKIYFTQEKDIGIEYFSGCLNDMIKLFNTICGYNSIKWYKFDVATKFKSYDYDLDSDCDDFNDIYHLDDGIYRAIPNKPGKLVKLNVYN